MLSDIYAAADRREVTLLGLLDLSAAFDCDDHDILIERLQQSFGSRGNVLTWIRSFLLYMAELFDVVQALLVTRTPMTQVYIDHCSAFRLVH